MEFFKNEVGKMEYGTKWSRKSGIREKNGVKLKIGFCKNGVKTLWAGDGDAMVMEFSGR